MHKSPKSYIFIQMHQIRTITIILVNQSYLITSTNLITIFVIPLYVQSLIRFIMCLFTSSCCKTDENVRADGVVGGIRRQRIVFGSHTFSPAAIEEEDLWDSLKGFVLASGFDDLHDWNHLTGPSLLKRNQTAVSTFIAKSSNQLIHINLREKCYTCQCKTNNKV